MLGPEDFEDEEEFIAEEDRSNLLEDDEISPEEEGFMEGFEEY
ncbi:MAG: hypothetical protein PWP03_194 [Candidatus Woesearchaeota archaeon]|nr:hypothetical protein [Candidatus Woesearchaeota archaeon]MDN5327556.1 hypothetical protein [Candidatus Woesearchaeota archaeon]